MLILLPKIKGDKLVLLHMIKGDEREVLNLVPNIGNASCPNKLFIINSTLQVWHGKSHISGGKKPIR